MSRECSYHFVCYSLKARKLKWSVRQQMFSKVFIDRTRNAARGSTHGAAAIGPGSARPCDCLDVAIENSCVLALVSLAFKLSQLAMPKVSTYTRTRIELLLTVVIFRHVIINSSDREEACTKFTTAEYYFDVRALVLSG